MGYVALLFGGPQSGLVGWMEWMLSNSMILTSHRCSIGDMSGEHAGHGNTMTLLAPRMFYTILAVWGLALSC